MSDTVLVALISLFGVIITGAMVPLATFAWKQWKERDAAVEQRGREKERAETYEREATAAMNSKNKELSAAKSEIEELEEVILEQKSLIFRLTDNDIPHMLQKLDERDKAIANLADAYEKLADQKAVES